MARLNPYLNFNGNTEEAFNFYKSVFGGEFAMLQRFRDTPEATKLPEQDQNKIMHVALPIGNGNVLMATDALESMGQKLSVGNNFYISVSTDSVAETDKLFNGLSAGGKIELPLQKTFWGAYFGMFRDKFGIQWMLNYDEIQRSN
jgi:PhnB protein